MAKTSGLGNNLFIGGTDCSGDINAVGEMGGGPALLDFTGINSSGVERRGGVRTGRLSATSFFNPTNAHPELSALPTDDVHLMYTFGSSIGSAAAGLVSKQIGYDGTRGDDGEFKFAVDALSNAYGLEFVTLVTAGKRSDTTATNGSSLDFSTIDGTAGSLAFGLQAYLQVFSFTGTSCTVKLQGSSDDGVGDSFADITGGTFGAQTASGASRIATATNLSVERYVRVVTTGTFSECTFAVALVRNLATPEF